MRIPTVTPVRREVHPVVQELLDRLNSRLTPLKWLTSNNSDISIHVARTIYVTFIRSVISPALIQIPTSALEPLEKFQNRVMRIILGCPMSIRIVNMQKELSLSPFIDRIHADVTCSTVKCLHLPHLSPHYSQVVRRSLDPPFPTPDALPGGRTLVNNISKMLRRLDIDVPVAKIPPGPPTWLQPTPVVSFNPTSKSDFPPLQKQLALESIETVMSSIPAPHRVYTDGSLQVDGAADSAVFSPDLEPPGNGWVGHRISDRSSSTLYELYAILDAVSLIWQRGVNAIIICDSKPALLSLSCVGSTNFIIVQMIVSYLALLRGRELTVKFLWIPSHIGLRHNDTIDTRMRAVCPSLVPPPAPLTQLLPWWGPLRRSPVHAPPLRHREIPQRQHSTQEAVCCHK